MTTCGKHSSPHCICLVPGHALISPRACVVQSQGMHKCQNDVLVAVMQQSPLGRLLLDGVAPENLPAEQTRLQIVANMIHHSLAQKISALDGGEDAKSALLGFRSLKLMKASVLPRLVGVL